MIKRFKVLFLSAAITFTSIGLVGCGDNKNTESDKMKVTLVLDEGGVNDQSFNESAWSGALAAKENYGVEVSYIESKQESEYLQNVESAIDLDSDLIIGVGFKLTDTILDAALAYPEQQFAIIDGTYDNIPDNVVSILFNEEQSGYSVGLIAAEMTETNKVGFIGGMDIPSVTNFLVGFEKAIKEVNPDATVVSQYANSFTDAAKGKAISEQMINTGVDIIFTAGGGVNSGSFEAVKENDKLAIGVDMPSNYIAPEVILTSALKNVGTGVELTVKDLVSGEFKGGQVSMFDLSNGGVGFEKTNLLPVELIEKVENKLNNIK